MDEKTNENEGKVVIVVAQDRTEEAVVAADFAPINMVPRDAEAWFRTKHAAALAQWVESARKDARMLGEEPNTMDAAEPFVRAVVLPAEAAFRILEGEVDAYGARRLVNTYAGTVAEHWFRTASPKEYARELRAHAQYRGVEGSMTARLLVGLAERLDDVAAWPGSEPRNVVCQEHARARQGAR